MKIFSAFFLVVLLIMSGPSKIKIEKLGTIREAARILFGRKETALHCQKPVRAAKELSISSNYLLHHGAYLAATMLARKWRE